MLSLLVLALAAQTASEPYPILEAGVFAARPAALRVGQVIGPSAGSAWRFGAWSLGLGARLGFVEENDLVWTIHHTELHIRGLVEHVTPIGIGEIGVAASGGGFVVRESRERHQAERLDSAGFETSATGSTSGAELGLELALRLFVDERWAVVTAGALTLGVCPGLPDEDARVGWNVALAIAHAFGG